MNHTKKTAHPKLVEGRITGKYLLLLTLSITTLLNAAEQTIVRIIPDPKHTKFAFDLHDVVLQRDIARMKEVALKREHLPLLINVCNLSLMSRVMRLAARRATAEEYVLLFEEYNRPELSKLVQDIANQQIANNGVVAIIEELKQLGYTVDMVSDIGTHHLVELEKKDTLKNVLELFDNKFSVDYKKKPVIQKPQEQYFKNYLKTHNKKHKTVIFIDDKKENIKGAQKVGIVGLCFSNADQLRKDLQELGVLEKSKA